MTRLRTPIASLALLAACGGSQLAELEEEHAKLRREYDDLAANVEALRREMVQTGLITEAQANARVAPAKGDASPKAGKGPGKKKAPGAARPANDLGEALPFRAARSGEVPTLPALPPAERAEGDCGWKFTVEALQPLSDFPLNRDGFGKSSPVVLLEDGRPMAAHAAPEAFEQACAGAFRHAGYLLLFSPTGAVDDGGRRAYQAALAPDFPLPRGDDARPMYWVYPGTTATFTFEAPWSAEWGEPRLTVAGRLLLADGGSAALVAPGLERTLDEDGNFHVGEVLKLDAAGFSVELSSPADGPYALIDTLTLGNPDHAVVVTAESAWAARTP